MAARKKTARKSARKAAGGRSRAGRDFYQGDDLTQTGGDRKRDASYEPWEGQARKSARKGTRKSAAKTSARKASRKGAARTSTARKGTARKGKAKKR